MISDFTATWTTYIQYNNYNDSLNECVKLNIHEISATACDKQIG